MGNRSIHWRLGWACIAATLIAGCATPATSPVRSTAVSIDDGGVYYVKASAPLTCSHEATETTAMKVAAIETLHQGFDRFKVLWSETSDNIQSVTGQAMIPLTIPYGNGQSLTTFVPAGYSRTGTRDGILVIEILQDDDAAADDTTNARSLLGPNWKSLMETGITSCG